MSNRKLNDREINTILHALRTVAQNLRDDIPDNCTGCDHFIDAPCLDSIQIDALCESIGLDSLTLEIDEDENPLDQSYREAADEKFGDGGQIEIDDNAVISYGEDDGAYVQAWVWVEGDLVPNVCNGDGCKALVKSGDSYYGSPCGTYCEECMHSHAKVCGQCSIEFNL